MNYTQYFTTTRRPNGDLIITCKDAPTNLQNLIMSIHQNEFFDCLPNAWIYSNISDAFEALQLDDIENCSIEADIYYNELINWLSNPFAPIYCNETMQEFGPFDDFYKLVASAQVLAKQRIYKEVNEFLQTQEGVKD